MLTVFRLSLPPKFSSVVPQTTTQGSQEKASKLQVDDSEAGTVDKPLSCLGRSASAKQAAEAVLDCCYRISIQRHGVLTGPFW